MKLINIFVYFKSDFIPYNGSLLLSDEKKKMHPDFGQILLYALKGFQHTDYCENVQY